MLTERIDYDTGKVRCIKCGTELGNYQTENFYRLIRLKYCPKCKHEITKAQQRIYQRKRRKQQKEYKSLIEERNKLLQAENKMLRQQLFGNV